MPKNREDRSLVWLSFCDPTKPEGEQFLGAAIVRAENLGDALTKSWKKGCNPGGEVAGVMIECTPEDLVEGDFERLIQHDEMERRGWKPSKADVLYCSLGQPREALTVIDFPRRFQDRGRGVPRETR